MGGKLFWCAVHVPRDLGKGSACAHGHAARAGTLSGCPGPYSKLCPGAVLVLQSVSFNFTSCCLFISDVSPCSPFFEFYLDWVLQPALTTFNRLLRSLLFWSEQGCVWDLDEGYHWVVVCEQYLGKFHSKEPKAGIQVCGLLLVVCCLGRVGVFSPHSRIRDPFPWITLFSSLFNKTKVILCSWHWGAWAGLSLVSVHPCMHLFILLCMQTHICMHTYIKYVYINNI